ncbi:MAG: hypothetical protein SangKO_077530 [Sandaracinaceae bacterium]
MEGGREAEIAAEFSLIRRRRGGGRGGAGEHPGRKAQSGREAEIAAELSLIRRRRRGGRGGAGEHPGRKAQSAGSGLAPLAYSKQLVPSVLEARLKTKRCAGRWAHMGERA